MERVEKVSTLTQEMQNTVSPCPAHTRSAMTSLWTGRDPYTHRQRKSHILKLSAGATTFVVFAQDSAFSPPQGGAGLDGIAFGSDGNLYVTTYTAGELLRVEVKDGKAGASRNSPVTVTCNFPMLSEVSATTVSS